jgi:hypothetical protein
MISLFTKTRGVRLSLLIYSGGAKTADDPAIEIRNALETYWGEEGGDCKSDRLRYLGGGVTVSIKEESDNRVVAEVDSMSGWYAGIAVLTRKIGPVEAGSMTDWEDGPPWV